jgi:hypothetical protein
LSPDVNEDAKMEEVASMAKTGSSMSMFQKFIPFYNFKKYIFCCINGLLSEKWLFN